VSAENEGSGSDSPSKPAGNRRKKRKKPEERVPGRKPDKTHVWLSEEMATSLVAEIESSLPTQRNVIRERYGVHEATLTRWIQRVYGNGRKGSAGDERLRALVEEKKLGLRKHWEEQAVRAHRLILEAMADQAVKALTLSSFDPHAMHSLAGGAKLLGELLIGDRLIPSGQPRNSSQNPSVGTGQRLGPRAPSGGSATSGVTAPSAASAADGERVH
jgi:hypothetical protein